MTFSTLLEAFFPYLAIGCSLLFALRWVLQIEGHNRDVAVLALELPNRDGTAAITK